MVNFPKTMIAYGFNKPEESFCWTTHEFGIRVAAGHSLYIAFQTYARRDHTLHCFSNGTGSSAYRLRDSSQAIRVRNASADEQVFHFRVEPKISYSSDIRDLGILVTALVSEVQRGAAGAFGSDPRLLSAGWSDFRPRDGPEVASVLAEHLLRAFVDRGWLRTHVLEVTDRRFTLEFAIYPPRHATRERDAATFRVNDTTIVVPAARPADASAYLLKDLPGECYRGVLDCSAPYQSNSQHLDIELVWGDDPPQFRGQTQHWRGPGRGSMPAQANITRVAGHISNESFAFTGATWFVKLGRLAQRLVGPDFGGGRILDWGCGCGRILRFFPAELAHRVHGADIDSVNIDWCRRHYDGPFELIASSPPMPYGDGAFTLVYGHSVFTHLGEDDQFRWLSELARVLASGGYLLVTVLAELSWFARFFPDRRTPEGVAEYVSRGFFDDGWLDVGVDADSIGSYRSVSHTEDYIRDRWSRHFEIVDVVSGFADLQTLVVMRKR